MDYAALVKLIKEKKSFLCIGMDTDINKLPAHLKGHAYAQFEFNKEIIDATIDLTVAYKINLAFYESEGINGIANYEMTVEYLNNTYPNKSLIIADAKRGDIGNTSELYAKTFFDRENPNHNADAVTVAPYMGEDSVAPFLKYKDKWTIILDLTSNKGALDFQYFQNDKGTHLFEEVLKVSKGWGNIGNTMYVVGATQAQEVGLIRSIIPNHFLIIPGVGAQGGSLQEVVQHGFVRRTCCLLINSSRAIIFASNGVDFAKAARKEALEQYQQPMETILRKYGMIEHRNV